MNLEAVPLVLAGAAGWGILTRVLDHQAQFKRRVIDEVDALLRRPDEEQLRELLDAEEEDQGRSYSFLSRAGYAYRREQRSRLDRLQEQYRRLDHNSKIIFQWADTEWYEIVHRGLHESYGPELCAKIKEVRLAAIELRGAMRIALARMWLLGLLHFDEVRFMPVPSVAALARSGSIGILEVYRRVKESALVLAATYGDNNEYADEIAAAM